MATTNNRIKLPQASVINGVDAGGLMSASIQAGFENVLQSAPDGLQVATVDREVQFVRGSIVTQDWVEMVNLLTGTVGSYVFYERKSGVAGATGWIKHTLTAPVIHSVRITQSIRGFITCSFDFECRFAAETTTLNDAWVITDSQAAPTYIAAARGGYRVQTTVHGATSIYHVTAFEFAMAIRMVKACNDADLGYTCVDADLEAGIACGGSITCQDGSITTSQLLANKLLVAAKADLVITCTQSQGATAKVLTIANTAFTSQNENASPSSDFTPFALPFLVANDPSTPLTVAGDNKIITIANAT